MSLTAISSLESARSKFFMNSTYIMSTNQKSLVLGSGGQNESNSHQLAQNGENIIFHELDVHHVQKVGIKRFSTQQAKISLTANSSLGSTRKKFFLNDVHHVYKVGITCFWAQDAKMSLTAISSLESARRTFFMNSTYIMSTKQESNVFGLRRPK